MKAVFLQEPRHYVIEDIPKPVADGGDLLVKIAYCGICTLEQRLYFGDRKIYYPIIPGHEASGIIEKVGKDVKTHHQSGDRVALDLVNRCHICPACLSGNSNMCENRFKKGQRVLGGFAEYILVRPEQAYVIPPELTLDKAAFSEPVACCIRSLKKVALEMGETLVIIGAGPMGMMHLKTAMLKGARVFVTDIDKNRLADAKSMGADITLDASNTEKLVEEVKALTGGRGADCCIVTSPAKAAMEAAVGLIANVGRINVYTSYNDKPALPMDMNTLHRMEVLITGSEGRSEQDFFQSTRILSYGKIEVSDLISRVYPLEEVTAATELALSGSAYRVLLKTGDNNAAGY